MKNGPAIVALEREIEDLRCQIAAVEMKLDLASDGASLAVELALANANALLDAIFESAPIGLGVWDRDLRFVRVNARLAEINGIPPEAHIGKRPDELLPDISDLAPLLERWKEILATGQPWLGVEIKGTTPAKPGEVRSWRESFFPVRVSGQVVGLAATVEETTEQRRADEECRETEERLEFALEAAGAAAWEWIEATGELVSSERTRRLFGIAADRPMTREEAMAALLPEDIPVVVEAGARTVKTGAPFHVRVRTRHPDGSVRWIASDAELRLSNGGRRLAGLVRDITDERRAEEVLSERASLATQLSKIADSTPGVICSFRLAPDGAACFPYAAASMKDVCGLDPEEVRETAAPVLTRIHSDDQEHVAASNSRSAAELTTWHDEFRFLHPSKGEIWIEARSSPIREPDGSIVWHGIVQDVTERKRAADDLARLNAELEHRVAERTLALEAEMKRREAAQEALAQSQRLEAVGRLAGGLVHDFNNALTAISANLELAELSIADEKARDAIRRALDAVEMSASLNRRLLTFTRRVKSVRERVSVNERVTNILALLERTLGPDVTFEAALAPELWPSRFDPAEFDSALLNLAINARDAMPSGGRIGIATRNVPTAGNGAPSQEAVRDCIEVSVHDNGVGMSPKVLRKALEPFFTTKDPSRSTGLGLSGVREFARSCGGSIAIKSEQDVGTTVSLLLPRDTTEPLGTAPAAAAGEPPLGDGETILLVEDNERVLETTHALLEGLSYAVVPARNGQEALEILRSGELVHAVFSDILMPGGMSGYDVARHVLAEWPHVPVVLTSGFNSATLLQGDRVEHVELLAKPYTRGQLAVVLDQALGRARRDAAPCPRTHNPPATPS